VTAKAGVAPKPKRKRKPKVKVGFGEKVQALLRDPDFRLRMFRSGWEGPPPRLIGREDAARLRKKFRIGLAAEEIARIINDEITARISELNSGSTGNPVYVWEAIAVCAEHNMPLRDWIISYLADVAERMTSDDARASTDLRAILPGIMGFSTKPGPGRLLNPDDDPDDKLLFAIRFAIEIEKGKKPSQALRDASTNVLSADLRVDDRTLLRWSNADDRTLRGWVKKVLYLPPQNAPRTNAEWKAVLRRHFEHFYLFTEQEFRQEFRKTPPR
jgi:hypothetical protein